MKKQGLFFVVILAVTMMLSACLGSVWTGAKLVYDRHNVYKKIDDYSLSLAANHALFGVDNLLKQPGCYLDLAVFNGDVLLAGHVPSTRLRRLAEHRLDHLSEYRHLYKQIAVTQDTGSGLDDAWITTKIRSKIIADADIDPGQFKIVTVDHVVYVMGDVKPQQSLRVLAIAKNTKGVIRVVKLMKYYNLSKKPSYSK